MQMKPFLLDQWLNRAFTNEIEYDLGTSTGPVWKLGELFELLTPEEQQQFFEMKVSYAEANGTSGLRNAVAQLSKVEPEHVQIVTGASEALLILFFLSAEPGANVVLPFPLFPPMAEIPRAFGLETRFYRLRPESRFEIDLDELFGLVDERTRIIFVNTPHNPTGAVVKDADLQTIHDFAASRGIQFVVDEVYHPLYIGQEQHASAAQLPHATVLGDFSKALCLSGLRLGWIIERDLKKLEQYTDARSYFTISNSPITEFLGAIAIQHSPKLFERAKQKVEQNVALLDRFFLSNSKVMRWVRPPGGTTAFPWLVSGADTRPFCEALIRDKILMVPGDCFDMPSHFRIGFGATTRDLSPALAKIAAAAAGRQT